MGHVWMGCQYCWWQVSVSMLGQLGLYVGAGRGGDVNIVGGGR